MSRRFWTEAEELKLITMLAQDKSVRQIAPVLGRTVHSVHNKCARMGLSKEKPRAAEAKAAHSSKDGAAISELKLFEQETAHNFSVLLQHVDGEMTELRRRITALESEGSADKTAQGALALAKAALEAAKVEETRRGALQDDVNIIIDYLSRGWLWRLFHGFGRHIRKIWAEEKKGGAK